jgi:hypothetical protein
MYRLPWYVTTAKSVLLYLSVRYSKEDPGQPNQRNILTIKNKNLEGTVPGNHVAARVGKLDVRNGGDNFREKGPAIKRKMSHVSKRDSLIRWIFVLKSDKKNRINRVPLSLCAPRYFFRNFCSFCEITFSKKPSRNIFSGHYE